MDDDARDIVQRFGLMPHPEGGYYREIHRSGVTVEHPGIPAGRDARRSGGTFIYFLLADGDFSAFHRVRWSDEIWHLYAGGPLEVHLIDDHGRHSERLLTSDLVTGEPATVVDAGCWQATRLAPGAKWAFTGCTVSPGFDFSDFDMPTTDELLAAHPEHGAIIRQLTRR